MKYELFSLFSDDESQASERINSLLNFSNTPLSCEGEIGSFELTLRPFSTAPCQSSREYAQMSYSFCSLIICSAKLLKGRSPWFLASAQMLILMALVLGFTNFCTC